MKDVQWEAVMQAEDSPVALTIVRECPCGAPITTGNKRAKLCPSCFEARSVAKEGTAIEAQQKSKATVGYRKGKASR